MRRIKSRTQTPRDVYEEEEEEEEEDHLECETTMMMMMMTTTTTTSPTPFVSSCRREVKKRSSKNVRSRTPFVTERQSTRWRRFYSTTTRTTRASCTTKTRFDVYIEDTDHYAVVYYANYFRFCAKAFENALRMRGEFGRDDDVVECYRIEEAKYQQPAVLGDVLTVETTIVNDNGDDGITWKRWIVEHTVRKRRGEKDDADDAPVFTCRVRYGRADQSGCRDSEDSTSSDTDRIRATNIRLFASELNHRSVWHADVLRWFERNRTDLIGGPKALETLKSKDDCVVVVSSIRDVRISSDALANVHSMEFTTHVDAGEPISLSSFSSVRFLRRDVQCEFDQRVCLDDAVVASGKVTCTVLKRDTMRPRASPDSLKARLLRVA